MDVMNERFFLIINWGVCLGLQISRANKMGTRFLKPHAKLWAERIVRVGFSMCSSIGLWGPVVVVEVSHVICSWFLRWLRICGGGWGCAEKVNAAPRWLMPERTHASEWLLQQLIKDHYLVLWSKTVVCCSYSTRSITSSEALSPR